MTRQWNETFGGHAAAGTGLPHWAHHDLVVLDDGRLVAPAPDGGLLLIGADGTPTGTIETDTNEIHGLTVVAGTRGEELWIADCGFTMAVNDSGDYVPAGRGATRGPRAVRIDLRGAELQSIGVPGIDEYAEALFLPTSVAVDEARFGGSGDLWVADGYGAGLVHRFDHAGNLLGTLDGTSGAGRFDTPHAVFIDRRGETPGLLVADRGNARVQVFELDGTYRTTFGEGELTSPSAFATVGDQLVIAELNARIVVLDGTDAIVEVIGEHDGAVERPGWPNALDGDGHPVRPPLERGRFNSPHGLAVDARGRLFVSEWLIGGRLISLSEPGDPDAIR